jgi:hypothetical protein
MCLTPFFSITPNEPLMSTYDANQPTATYAVAHLFTFGGVTTPFGLRLPDQHASNELTVGHDALPSTNRTISSFSDVSLHCGLWLHFVGYNVTAKNQYLVVFKLKSTYPSAAAQFFVGFDFLESHPLTVKEERHAILIDCPGDGAEIDVFVRLESTESSHSMTIMGVECCFI